MKRIWNIEGTKKRVMLCRSNTTAIVMEGISDEADEAMDRTRKLYNEISYKVDNKVVIPGSNIFVYGELDFDNEEDRKLLDSFKLINPDIEAPNASLYYTGFDYDKGIIESDEEGKFRWSHTWNQDIWLKYCYCLIGKPKRIIIYEIQKAYIKNVKF